MTVDALRRRRPETLGALLDAYGHELQSVAYLILRDRADFAEDGGERVAMSVGMLPPGDWIVRVSLNATNGSDSFGAVYEMPLRVGG
jgi:hypothetical protein